MSMKKFFVLGAVVFQVVAVAAIAIKQEWILASGEKIIFQTAPIDPRDIFRGDYVRLQYLFSNLPLSMLDDDIVAKGARKGDKVFLRLKTDKNGLSHGTGLGLKPPPGGLYLTGRATSHWPYKSFKRKETDSLEETRRQLRVHHTRLSVKYGIEQYFVEQGHGKAMEKRRGTRTGFQTPLLIHAALASDGNAVIRSHQWANIAVKTEVLRSPERDAVDAQASAVMRFTIKNQSGDDVTLPWKSNQCSLALNAVNSISDDFSNLGFDRSECVSATPGNKTLASGESVSVEFDLNQPKWFVNFKGKATPMGKLSWNYRFRIVHEDASIRGINARIISRAFHGRGNID